MNGARGFVFIQFETADMANKAMLALNGKTYGGFPVVARKANPKVKK